MKLDNWFYASGGQQLGPVSLEVVRQMAASGQLRREDLVWTEGLPQWVMAGTRQGLGGLLGGFLGIIFSWLYYALMESSARQATVGKLVCGIIVMDLNGGRLGFGQATGRHFAKILSGIILCIGFMKAGWTEKKQALHDMVAGTLVVRK